MTNSSIAGLGPALSKKILTQVGGEEHLREIAAQGNVEALAQIPGVSEARAVKVIQSLNGQHDETLHLDEGAEKVATQIRQLLVEEAVTKEARDRIKLMPLFADPQDALAQLDLALEWKDKAGQLDVPRLRTSLRRVGRLAEPKAYQKFGAILRVDEEEHDALRENGFSKWISIVAPGSQPPDAELILCADPDDPAMALPNAVHVNLRSGLHGIVPESVLEWFKINRGKIEALAEIATQTGSTSCATAAAEILAQPPPAAPQDVTKLVEEITQWAEQEIEARVSNLTLTGSELLATLGGTPAKVTAVISEVIDEAHNRLYDEARIQEEIFTVATPIAVDEKALARVIHNQRGELAVQEYSHQTALAKQLAPLMPKLMAEVQAAIELDFELAIGNFAQSKKLRPWQLGKRLHIEGALHILIDPDVGQRIDYELGSPNVALLTGANSGGKTTLLETLAQTIILARMGLPTTGVTTQLPWFDSLHVIHRRRSMDAGAFESFLRNFVPLATNPGKSLILADEVEAITELDAAVKILRFWLAKLASSGHHAVLVTHMAPQITGQSAVAGVRIDGIHATGLAEDGTLLVDRNPRLGTQASSTPRLIVERLAREGNPLWDELLGVFSGEAAKNDGQLRDS